MARCRLRADIPESDARSRILGHDIGLLLRPESFPQAIERRLFPQGMKQIDTLALSIFVLCSIVHHILFVNWVIAAKSLILAESACHGKISRTMQFLR